MLSFDDAMAAADVMIRDLPFLQTVGAPPGVPEAVNLARYALALHLLYAARQRREGKKRRRRWAKGGWDG